MVSLDDALSQVSSVTSSVNNAGIYEIPARLRTLHNLVIQYASQVYTINFFKFRFEKLFMESRIKMWILRIMYDYDYDYNLISGVHTVFSP